MATKNIANVEEIESLDGTEKVFVNSNGSLKQIKTENAKFGGGGTRTVFYAGYASQVATQAKPAEKDTLYTDIECTQVATAQEVYDAWANGDIWIFDNDSGFSGLGIGFSWVDSNITRENPADVVYCTVSTYNTSYYNGTEPGRGDE